MSHENAAGTPPADDALLARVRQAWADVLDTDSPDAVPLDTNFLEAGGSSLLLVMLWEELHGLTARQLKVSDLFQHATVRSQARFLAEETAAPAAVTGGRNLSRLAARSHPSPRAAAPTTEG